MPKALKGAHIAYLNSLSALLQGVQGMSLIETDPIGATKMMQSYENGLNSISIPPQFMRAYFKKEGVIFSPSESGYLFMQ